MVGLFSTVISMMQLPHGCTELCFHSNPKSYQLDSEGELLQPISIFQLRIGQRHAGSFSPPRPLPSPPPSLPLSPSPLFLPLLLLFLLFPLLLFLLPPFLYPRLNLEHYTLESTALSQSCIPRLFTGLCFDISFH